MVHNLQRKRTKIRNQYNQAPHLTQDSNGKVTTSPLDIPNESQEVSPFRFRVYIKSVEIISLVTLVMKRGRCYVSLCKCTAPGLEVLIRLDEPLLALALGCSKLSLPDCDTNLLSLIQVLGSFISGLVLHGQSYIVK